MQYMTALYNHPLLHREMKEMCQDVKGTDIKAGHVLRKVVDELLRRGHRSGLGDVIAQVGEHDDDVARAVFATHGKQQAAAASARTKPRRSPAQQAKEAGQAKASEGRLSTLEKERAALRKGKQGRPQEDFNPDEWRQ